MLRGSRWALAMAALLAIAPNTVQAQFGNGYYPGGYGNYGWGGWSGTATAEGNIARGLGYYNMGAGEFNRDTAVANAVNANAVLRWNQFVYQSQLEANRREQQRLARRKDRVVESIEARTKRLRENPSQEDICDGTALNIVLDDLTDPRIHGSALRMAKTPIKGSTIRSIPFNDASEAVTISMNQLVAKDETWPPALRADAFRAEREAYRQAVAAAMKEDEEGEISPRTLRDVRNAVAALRVKANKSIRKPSPDYLQAQQYIQALAGMTRMLENPNIEPVLKELEKVENTTVGNLLGFMHTFNLRFGQATTPEQRAIYTDLYPILVSHRDQVVKEAGIPPKGTEKDQEEGSPTDFFQGLERDPPGGQNEGANPGQGKAQDSGENAPPTPAPQ
jgi:hypothetical protein